MPAVAIIYYIKYIVDIVENKCMHDNVGKQ
jgi:hypothetical protein